MADETVKVEYEIDTKDYIKGVNKIEKETKETNDSIVQGGDKVVESNKKTKMSFKDMKLAVVAFGAAAGIAIKKTIDWLANAANKADQYSMSMKGLNEVAKAYSEDGGAAQKMAKQLEAQTKGLVSAEQAAQGLKFLLSSSYSLDQASEMSQALLNVGAFNNVVGDLGQAFVDSAKGIKTGSIELIENIGLTEKLSSVMKRAGIDTSNGIDITNNAEQAQALYNSVMKQGVIFQGNLDKATEEYNATIGETTIVLDKVVRKIGKSVQPVFAAVAKEIGNMLKPFVEEEPEKASKKLEPLITRMAELQSKTELTTTEQEELLKVMNDMSVISPQMVTSYDNQGNAIINLGNATQELIDLKIDELEAEKALIELENIRADKTLKDSDEEFKKTKEIFELNKKLRIDQIYTTALTERQRELALQSIEDDESYFDAKFREELARENSLKRQITLGESRIEQIDVTLKKLKETEGLESYKTVIKETETVTETKAEDAKTEVPTKRINDTISINQRISEEMTRYNEEQDAITRKAIRDQETAAEEQKLIDERNFDYYKEQNRQKEEEQKKHKETIDRISKDAAKNLKQDESDVLAIIEQANSKEKAMIGARIGLKQAEAQIVNDLVKGELKSAGEYAKVIATQVETVLTGIAVESGIQSLYNLAKGFAFAAVGKADSSAAAFSASATFATTAAAAGLGATAAHSIGSSIETPTSSETESGINNSSVDIPTGFDTENVVDTTRENIEETQTIYISEGDFKRMSFGMVDTINDALKDGKKLAVSN